MAVNQFYKYIWLIQTIQQAGRISFEDINKKWLESDVSEGLELSKRTFHKWRIAIEETFNLVIENEKSGQFRYYIENEEELATNRLTQWLISSMSVSSTMMDYKNIHQQILLEDIPKADPFLPILLDGIKSGLTMLITYKSFNKSTPFTFEVEPYGVKLFRQRWYVVARNVYYNKIMIYAIDRMEQVEPTDKKFNMPEGFNLTSYFDGCYGIVSHDGTPFENVRIKVYGKQVDYFQTLPLHSSQIEIEEQPDYTIFEYSLYPTFDFIKDVLSYGENIEVIAPDWLRTNIAERIQAMTQRYRKK